MKAILGVIEDFKVYFNYKNKKGRRRIYILIAILAIALIAVKIINGGSKVTDEPEPNKAQVSVLSVAELGATASFDTIGKVEAISEAKLQAEASGRVTSVNFSVGDIVSAGAILATFENSAARASLVQAEGAYEAALAAAAQGNISVSEASTALTTAENGVISTVQSSYNTVNGVVKNSVDEFFANPDSKVPGLKIDGRGMTATINNERVLLQEQLLVWQTRTSNLSSKSNLDAELEFARLQTDRTIALVDTFIDLFNAKDADSSYTATELQGFSVSFTALRGTLLGIKSGIDSAEAGLDAARDAVRRAEIASSGGLSSAADAQVKIALGSLQAAQSNYQKSIVRSPIQGVVNALYIKTGDYAAMGQPVGLVANNNGLQIKTYVSEIDSTNLEVGDAVTIEDTATGIITAKAEALDPTNGKVAIIVGVNPDSNLTNGATVRVRFAQISDTEESKKILVPLSALKITTDGVFVFTVGDNQQLISIPVKEGQLYGDNIELLEGVTKETKIVTDARGLKEGQIVNVKE